jgi:putative PIN family toxin of toxin-antitoxin system
MKTVIDTNVFVSSFFGGPPRRIINLWKEEQLILCLSEAILDEYIEVLQRIGLREQDELKELLALFARGFNLRFCRKTPRLKIVEEDPGDDKFIECAVALKAEVIITGDRALRAIDEYQDIKILTPQQFLKQFSSRT